VTTDASGSLERVRAQAADLALSFRDSAVLAGRAHAEGWPQVAELTAYAAGLAGGLARIYVGLGEMQTAAEYARHAETLYQCAFSDDSPEQHP
jgi:hypothetical protein